MIEATVALPVSGPEGAYRLSRSANSVEAAAATVSRPRAAQPAPAAMVAATMPPLGSVSLACIRRLLEGRDRRTCLDGDGSATAALWPGWSWRWRRPPAPRPAAPRPSPTTGRPRGRARGADRVPERRAGPGG